MSDCNNTYIKVFKIKGANGEEKIMQFPMKLDLERPKRPRTTFTEEQLGQLEEAYQYSDLSHKLQAMFRINGYLTGSARAQLASRLGISDTQVKVWFQNRRTKERRKVAEPEKTSPPLKTESRPEVKLQEMTLAQQSFPYQMYYRLPQTTLPTPTLYPFMNPYITY